MKLSYLTLISCILGCLYLSGCNPTPSQHTAVGPAYFIEGNSIILEDIHSSLGTYEIGDTVAIKGSYKISDKSEAKLLLTITQTEGDGRSVIAPEQATIINGEEGDFELSIKIQYKGYLHLSLRTASGEDKVFGGLYFGTKNQMNEIEDWDLSKRYQK